MLDQYIGYSLLRKIPNHSRVVFVGDPNQLPSVGCGNFLSDLIQSTVIPTAKLTEVHRQAKENPIIENADLILQGYTNLNLTKNSFIVYEEPTKRAIFKRAKDLYLSSVKLYGIENVILLNAQRKSGQMNVNVFNEYLQKKINPLNIGQPTIQGRNFIFRKGDRIMQTRNTDIAKNGDVGTIVDVVIETDPVDPEISEVIAKIEFNDDGIVHDYTKDMIDQIDLAYCTTIHKSQGSEYHTVIMVVYDEPNAKWSMNNRSIVYTGITRASENIAIVTDRVPDGNSSFKRAIRNTKNNSRYTMLAPRLRAALHTV